MDFVPLNVHQVSLLFQFEFCILLFLTLHSLVSAVNHILSYFLGFVILMGFESFGKVLVTNELLYDLCFQLCCGP